MKIDITTRELNQLLHMAVEKHGLDPKTTYIEFTWWDNVFKPMVQIDCDRYMSWIILVFGRDNCNLFYTSKDMPIVPTAFWIWKDAAYVDHVIHRPITVNRLMDNPMLLDFKTAKFLFSSSPVNHYVNINPYKTCVYKNRANDTVLAFYADDRDSGEYKPFSQIEPKDIKVVDDLH